MYVTSSDTQKYSWYEKQGEQNILNLHKIMLYQFDPTSNTISQHIDIIISDLNWNVYHPRKCKNAECTVCVYFDVFV